MPLRGETRFALVDEEKNLPLQLGQYSLSRKSKETNYTLRYDNDQSSTHGIVLAPYATEKGLEPAQEGGAVAILSVTLPVVKIAALIPGVYLIPEYVNALNGNALKDPALKRALQLVPAAKNYMSWVMVRPGDVLEGVSMRIRLMTAVSSNEQVQVGSSDPSLPNAESHLEHVAAETGLETDHALLPEPLPGDVQVDRSLWADDLDEPFENQSGIGKLPLVQETPTSKQRYVDVYNEAKEEPRHSINSGNKQIINNSQEMSQFSETASQVDREESQELLGSRDSANHANTKANLVESTVTPVEAVTDSENTKKTEAVIDITNNEKESTTTESDFATAPTEQHVDPITDNAATTLQKSSQPRRTKKRKSDEVAVVVEERSPKRLATLRTKSSKETKGQTAVQETNEPRTEPRSTNTGTPVSSPNSAKRTTKAPRIVFSNSKIIEKSSIIKFLIEKGAKTVDTLTPRGFDMLVVGNGDLKKTKKLLMAITFGKSVVTESWVLQSVKQDQLLDAPSFVPQDPMLEKQWGFSLAKTIHQDRRDLFKGKTILVTLALRKEYGSSGFKDMEELGKSLGAKQVVSKSFQKANQEKKDPGTLVMASEANDPDVPMWHEYGKTCYTKELISISVLRGEVDENDGKLQILSSRGVVKKKSGRSNNKSSS